MNNTEQKLLAELFSIGLRSGPFILVKSVKDRTWMFFEEDERKNLKVMPAGLAVIGVFQNARLAFQMFKKIFPLCNRSYEDAASFLTDIPNDLLMNANRVFDKYPIEEIIRKLKIGFPLIEHGSDPIIIDRLSESQG